MPAYKQSNDKNSQYYNYSNMPSNKLSTNQMWAVGGVFLVILLVFIWFMMKKNQGGVSPKLYYF